MNLEEAMTHLRAHEEPLDEGFSEEQMLTLVKREAQVFDESIQRRDRREMIAAAAVFIFFSLVFLTGSWLTRAGAAIVLAGCVSTYWMLARARRRHVMPSGTQPLGSVLRNEREKIESQIRLLRGIVWWYLGPLAIGVVLVFFSMAGATWISAAYTAAVIAFSAVIYYVNQVAVRRHLMPRRTEIDRLLQQIDESDQRLILGTDGI